MMYLLTPYLLFRLWWKGRKLPAYRQRISERFCLDTQYTPMPVDIWIHAVSLGEVIAAIPLIDALLDKQHTLLVTTMTPTGSQQLLSRFDTKIQHQYLPYDLAVVLRRFFMRYKPCLGIIMETEIWPNMIRQAKVAGIPLLLANARLSARSLQSYLRFRRFFKPILNGFTAIYAQSSEDAKRFITLGADKAMVQMLGNMKFDLQLNTVDNQKYQKMKQLWGKSRVVFIAASTHGDEESQILSQLRRLQQSIPQVLLLIAPRHPERFQKVYELSRQAGFDTGMQSLQTSVSEKSEVIILDSLGELLGFYYVSDYAFVGGSLVPVGGHNVLEPIAMNIPVFSGDRVHNFQRICNELELREAIQLVKSAEQLIDALIRLHKDKRLCDQMIQNASLVLKKSTGSLQKHIDQVQKILSTRLI